MKTLTKIEMPTPYPFSESLKDIACLVIILAGFCLVITAFAFLLKFLLS